MASTGWTNYYNLTAAGVDAAITRTSPGAYALGRVGEDGTFYVSRVGRSDSDVNARLKSQVGDYTHFKFGYFSSPKAAFEKECRLYHDFNPRDNKIHPDRPNGSGWECPVCTIFD